MSPGSGGSMTPGGGYAGGTSSGGATGGSTYTGPTGGFDPDRL
jgi:hypothetical protein